MNKFVPIIKWFLLIWGGFSFIGLLFSVGFFAYVYGPGNKKQIDNATKKDVLFVLKRCEINDTKFEKVINSYSSPTDLRGGGLDAYAIKIRDISAEELTYISRTKDSVWHRGDKLKGIADDALSFLVGSSRNIEIKWFPKEESIRTEKYYCCISELYYSKERAIGAAIIIINPIDKMVFYLSERN